MNIVRLMQNHAIHQQILSHPLTEEEQLEMEFIRVFPQFLEAYNKNQDHKQELEMILYHQIMPILLDMVHFRFDKPKTKPQALRYIEMRNKHIKKVIKDMGGTIETNRLVLRKVKKNDPWTQYVSLFENYQTNLFFYLFFFSIYITPLFPHFFWNRQKFLYFFNKRFFF
ncbi:uncharacterized protein BX664DRAFT_335226 [Halteromyces radiatus]|uniref:uncharacterized protein n=1 Tax=Halteromyces radiatus TaxID=101107 RepID=UPI00221E6689|nr:uncharacterized protein BX664DRAFT_335226 [Halteromyces radiatus]KAI8086230.1 hypothetical protein BX664DRAFT_335226 [Halteromyces radiatus]